MPDQPDQSTRDALKAYADRVAKQPAEDARLLARREVAGQISVWAETRAMGEERISIVKCGYAEDGQSAQMGLRIQVRDELSDTPPDGIWFAVSDDTVSVRRAGNTNPGTKTAPHDQISRADFSRDWLFDQIDQWAATL